MHAASQLPGGEPTDVDDARTCTLNLNAAAAAADDDDESKALVLHKRKDVWFHSQFHTFEEVQKY